MKSGLPEHSNTLDAAEKPDAAQATGSSPPRSAGTLLLTWLIGAAAAALFVWLNTPLPWLLGPLLVIATLRMLGVPLWSPALLRNAAHVIIGIALGLYFTPDTVARMLSLWLPILLGMGFALMLSQGFATVLRRAGLDPATAYFAGGIGGATEMTVMGEHHGGKVPVIIAVHMVRLIIVVVMLPVLFRLLDIRGSDLFSQVQVPVHWPGLLLLTLVALGMAVLFHRLRWPNGWMLGPLLVAAVATFTGLVPSALPEFVIQFGQLAIGVTLGSRFGPETIATVRRILPTLVVTSLAGIALATVFGAMVAWTNNLPVSTMVLATSPGGIAEMSLTAKVLQLGVPVVTVFHVTRLVFMLVCYSPFYLFLAGRFGWPSAGARRVPQGPPRTSQ